MVILHDSRASYMCIPLASSLLIGLTGAESWNQHFNIVCRSQKWQASIHFLHSADGEAAGWWGLMHSLEEWATTASRKDRGPMTPPGQPLRNQLPLDNLGNWGLLDNSNPLDSWNLQNMNSSYLTHLFALLWTIVLWRLIQLPTITLSPWPFIPQVQILSIGLIPL